MLSSSILIPKSSFKGLDSKYLDKSSPNSSESENHFDPASSLPLENTSSVTLTHSSGHDFKFKIVASPTISSEYLKKNHENEPMLKKENDNQVDYEEDDDDDEEDPQVMWHSIIPSKRVGFSDVNKSSKTLKCKLINTREPTASPKMHTKNRTSSLTSSLNVGSPSIKNLNPDFKQIKYSSSPTSYLKFNNSKSNLTDCIGSFVPKPQMSCEPVCVSLESSRYQSGALQKRTEIQDLGDGGVDKFKNHKTKKKLSSFSVNVLKLESVPNSVKSISPLYSRLNDDPNLSSNVQRIRFSQRPTNFLAEQNIVGNSSIKGNITNPFTLISDSELFENSSTENHQFKDQEENVLFGSKHQVIYEPVYVPKTNISPTDSIDVLLNQNKKSILEMQDKLMQLQKEYFYHLRAASLCSENIMKILSSTSHSGGLNWTPLSASSLSQMSPEIDNRFTHQFINQSICLSKADGSDSGNLSNNLNPAVIKNMMKNMKFPAEFSSESSSFSKCEPFSLKKSTVDLKSSGTSLKTSEVHSSHHRSDQLYLDEIKVNNSSKKHQNIFKETQKVSVREQYCPGKPRCLIFPGDWDPDLAYRIITTSLDGTMQDGYINGGRSSNRIFLPHLIGTRSYVEDACISPNRSYLDGVFLATVNTTCSDQSALESNSGARVLSRVIDGSRSVDKSSIVYVPLTLKNDDNEKSDLKSKPMILTLPKDDFSIIPRKSVNCIRSEFYDHLRNPLIMLTAGDDKNIVQWTLDVHGSTSEPSVVFGKELHRMHTSSIYCIETIGDIVWSGGADR